MSCRYETSFLARSLASETLVNASFDAATIPLSSGEPLSVRQAFDRFYGSNFGLHCSEEEPPRFGNFAYDQTDMETDLGPNVTAAGHQLLVAKTAALIITRESRLARPVLRLSPEEVGLTLFSLGLHDIDESTAPEVADALGYTIGDIHFGDKTPEHQERLGHIRTHIIRTVFPDVAPEVHAFYESLVTHKKPESTPSRIFAAAHLLVEATTGFDARRVYMEEIKSVIKSGRVEPAKLNKQQKLAGLFLEVSGNTIPRLYTFREISLVGDFLAATIWENRQSQA